MSKPSNELLGCALDQIKKIEFAAAELRGTLHRLERSLQQWTATDKDAEIARLRAGNAELLAAFRGVMRFALPITNYDVEDFAAARKAIANAEKVT